MSTPQLLLRNCSFLKSLLFSSQMLGGDHHFAKTGGQWTLYSLPPAAFETLLKLLDLKTLGVLSNCSRIIHNRVTAFIIRKEKEWREKKNSVLTVMFCLKATNTLLFHLPLEVLDLIMSNLDIGALQLFKNSNPALRQFGNSLYITRVQKTLRQFKLNPMPFLQLLRDYDAVVVGDLPLLITFPNSLAPQSVVVIIPTAHLSTFAIHLTTSFGWTNEQESPDGLWTLSKDGVYMYLTPTTKSALTRMGDAPTTARMMFLSCKGLYIAYPSLTLNKRALRQVVPHSPWIHPGVHMREVPWIDCQPNLRKWPEFNNHVCMQNWACPQTIRRLHDKGGFFWALNDDLSREGHIYDGSRGTVWNLTNVICDKLGPTAAGFSRPTFTSKI